MRKAITLCPTQENHKGFMLLSDCRDECWITWLRFSSQAWAPGTPGAGRIVNYVWLNIMNICELKWVEPRPAKSLWSSHFILQFPWWGINTKPPARCHAVLLHCTGPCTLGCCGGSALWDWQVRSATFAMMTRKVLWTESRIVDCEVSEPLLSTRQ